MSRLYIIGSGGQAVETAEYAAAQGLVVIANLVERKFLAEHQHASALEDVRNPHAPCVVAVGAPGLRRRLAERWPGSFLSVMHTSAWVADSASVGAGTIVAPSSVISVGTSLGQHCLVNLGASVSHDCVLGSYVTVCPGCSIGGSVVIHDGAFLGIG